MRLRQEIQLGIDSLGAGWQSATFVLPNFKAAQFGKKFSQLIGAFRIASDKFLFIGYPPGLQPAEKIRNDLIHPTSVSHYRFVAHPDLLPMERGAPRMPLPLVDAHQLALSQHVPGHGVEQLLFRGSCFQIQNGI